jgi:hypothetical protein
MDRAARRHGWYLVHGAGFDEQGFPVDQALRDGRACPQQDSCKRRARNTHALRRGFLVQAFPIDQPDGLQLVEPDTHGGQAAGRAPQRTETATLESAADTSRKNRPRHEP